MKIEIQEGQEKVNDENLKVSVISPQPDKVELLSLTFIDNQIANKQKFIDQTNTEIKNLQEKRDQIAQAIATLKR